METKEDNAAVGFPPPLVYLGFVLLGLLIDRALQIPGLGLPDTIRYVGGAIVLIAGLAVVFTGIRLFHAADTDPKPWEPATALVTDGIYQVTRNPMYLGMAIAMIGLAVLFNSLSTLVSVPVVIVVITTQVIAREERYLVRKFGAEYEAYRGSVRRWL